MSLAETRLIFSSLATLTPLQKPECPQLISRTHNGQTSIRAAAVPQENMLKTLQWDQAILGLFCQLQNFRFITAATQQVCDGKLDAFATDGELW